MNTVKINGKIYNGKDIEIRNGVIKIDGVVQKDESAKGVVEIRVLEGTIEHLITEASVSCGMVRGNVNAGGSVNCDAVGGDVSAGGSVNCDDVGGRVTAGGSVRRG